MDLDALRRNIDTIVIVMLENRSFDHVLGHLSHQRYGNRSDVDGLREQGDDFDFGNPDTAGVIYQPEAVDDDWFHNDVPHGRSAITTEIAGGAMDGFVKAYFQSNPNDRQAHPPPMRFCKPTAAPTTAALAEHYSVCDRWFASVPADTQANRCVAVSGYTRVDSSGHLAPPGTWLPDQTTILDWLAQQGLPFELYVDAPFILGVGRPSNFMLMQSQWQHLDADHVFGLEELGRRWRMPGAGPAVVYCEPYYNDVARHLNTHGNCNHPPLPMAFGENFLKRVYDALTSNPERWKRSVMIVCYDEHGGFFDHVSPPALPYAQPADGHWEDASAFTTLGCRIPALVVSPYVEARSACHQLLDHTSILQFVVERFGVPDALKFFGSSVQRKAAGIGSVSAALTRSTPRTDLPGLAVAAVRLPAVLPAPADSANARLFAAAMRAKAAAHAAGSTGPGR